MLELQQQNQYFIFNLETQPAEPSLYFEPQFWQQQQRILGSAKGRGITWFVKSADLFGVNGALRHYYRGGLLGRLNKDRYWFSDLQHTRSFAEFHLLNKLHQEGLPVPKPIGARIIKGKTGICYQADLLSEKIENAQDLTVLLQHHSLPAESWQQIGQLIRQLHDRQICHTDLNAHNILVQHFATPEQKYWLLDFDKCTEKSGNSWKAKNLARLHRSFNKEGNKRNIFFNEKNWHIVLQSYNENKI
ncbi:3-deoxy-D-manno-octulosonic acid kinase [Avibacterium sp. 20-126]|uniref:3-deoxy-D-manno-octulosonic acid kinase n=1 Tax=Avibacterium sp. 20-126 TaxID=2911524 RepID=UPI002188C655|nr:3-deoxy-D-manno-octulosonic acid kinase [Avibacterium sp. 20-126]